MKTILTVLSRLNELGPDQKPELHHELFNNLGFDSIDRVELLMWAEETFDIEIGDDELLTLEP